MWTLKLSYVKQKGFLIKSAKKSFIMSITIIRLVFEKTSLELLWSKQAEFHSIHLVDVSLHAFLLRDNNVPHEFNTKNFQDIIAITQFLRCGVFVLFKKALLNNFSCIATVESSKKWFKIFNSRWCADAISLSLTSTSAKQSDLHPLISNS